MPPIAPTITTPRLTLIRLTDSSSGSQHVQWFHENWTDVDATAWSLHGPCKTLEDSRAWMIEHLTKYDNFFYAVFAKDTGLHVGSVSLRRQLDGPVLPPPDEGREKEVEVDLRVVGYAMFKSAWGKGYATEAGRAMMDAYGASVAEEKAVGKKVFYVEAGVDEGNPGSQAVLAKLGFRKVGWKTEKEGVFLGGQWRENGGYWIYGTYV
jgi:RimJ/RimL family protein N-acetyltransferase